MWRRRGLAGGEHHRVAVVVELLQQPLLEGVGIVHGQGGHDVEGAAGALADHAGDLVELGHHRVAAALILLADGGEVVGTHRIQRGGGHLIQRGHGQTALGVLHGLRHQLFVAGDHAADAGAAGGKPLGHRVDDDDVLRRVLELTHGLQRLVGVDELAVRLVADDEQVVRLGDVHHHAHLLRRQHGAGGVAGVGDHDGTGVLVDLRLHLGAVGVVIAVVGRGGNGVDLRAAGIGHGVVVGIERLGDEDLVAVVEDAVHGDLQRLAAAVGDKDITGVEVHVQIGVILSDRLDQLRDTGGRRIGQHRQIKVLHRVKIRLGRFNIGLADVQVIDLLSLGLRRHRIGVELAHGDSPHLRTLLENFMMDPPSP